MQKGMPVSSLKKFNAGTYLFREGEAPDAMYIVRSGALAVTKTKGSSEIVLAEIQVNGMVGEMALFDNKPRSANVKAIKDTEVVVLPYENLQSQMDQLPVWVKAIMKTLNENLRDANKKIRLLENPSQDEDRFPPHVINRLLSIINLVTYRFGKTVENQEGKSFSSVTLRNFTIQIFHEPTNKMTSMQTALVDLGLMKSEERGDGTQKLTITKPDTLLNLVDWYNDWLFKQEKDRLPPLTEEECRALKGLLVFAKKTEKDRNGKIKVNLNELQNESMKEFGSIIKLEDFNSMIEKKYFGEKVQDEKATYLQVDIETIEPQFMSWDLLNNIKKRLK